MNPAKSAPGAAPEPFRQPAPEIPAQVQPRPVLQNDHVVAVKQRLDFLDAVEAVSLVVHNERSVFSPRQPCQIQAAAVCARHGMTMRASGADDEYAPFLAPFNPVAARQAWTFGVLRISCGSKPTTMNVKAKSQLDLILGRRSIRVFTPGEVSDAVVTKLLEAAMAAPSAVAKDPWRFVVVRNRQTLDALAEVLSNGYMLRSATLSIAVCGDLEVAHDRQLSYLLQDCSAAIENLLLAAHALGLGACWLGVHPREERMRRIKEILALPASVIPVACVAVGHPGGQKEPRTRFNRDYVHFDKW